jgi:hypothetical protein
MTESRVCLFRLAVIVNFIDKFSNRIDKYLLNGKSLKVKSETERPKVLLHNQLSFIPKNG